MDDEIDSPCNRICVIERQSGLCRGCLRTLTEISCWTQYSRAEKLDLLAAIAQRKVIPAAASN